MSAEATDPAAFGRRWRDGADRYGCISRLNHWTLAALMIAMLLSGLALGYLPLAEAVAATLRDWHKALGVGVLALGLWRVGWRLVHGFPGGGVRTPACQALAAKAAHGALLAAIVLMPLSGLAMTLFAGRPIELGVLTIPSGPELAWLAGLAREVHEIGGPALAGLVALHVAAALKHHLVDRDGTLRRMGLRSPGGAGAGSPRPTPAPTSSPGRARTGRCWSPRASRPPDMTPDQQVLLLALVEARLGMLSEEDLAPAMAAIEAGLPETSFAWFGPTGDPASAYWRVVGPTVILEFSPQEMGGDPSNRLHNIYRVPTNEHGAAWAARP